MKIVSITSKSAKLCVSLLTDSKNGKTGIASPTLKIFTFTEKIKTEFKRTFIGVQAE